MLVIPENYTGTPLLKSVKNTCVVAALLLGIQTKEIDTAEVIIVKLFVTKETDGISEFFILKSLN